MTDETIQYSEGMLPQSRLVANNPNFKQSQEIVYNKETNSMATEQEAPETTEEAPEAEGSPTPSVPSVTSEAKSSAPKFNPDELVEQLSERLDKIVEDKVSRTFQSAKDRRFADVERIHKYLEESGGDVAKATREMQMDELYERIASEQAAGTAPQGNESASAYMQAQTGLLLEGAGIDFDDPGYLKLKAQYEGQITDPEQWVSTVKTFVETRQGKQAKQESVPAAAAASEGGSSSGVEGDSLEDLTAQLVQLQAQPKTPENMQARRALREKIAERQAAMDYSLVVDRT